MTQKSAKKKSKKSSKAVADPSVLGNLRSTRPARIGGERRATATRSRATATATAKPKATTAAPRKRAAKQAPAAATQSKATAAQRPVAPPPPPPPRSADGRPSGAEIVTTAVQATGELARIGITVGGQLLRRAARRIPRP